MRQSNPQEAAQPDTQSTPDTATPDTATPANAKADGATPENAQSDVNAQTKSETKSKVETKPDKNEAAESDSQGEQTSCGQAAAAVQSTAAAVQSTAAEVAGRVGHSVSDQYQAVQRQVSAAPITSTGVAFAAGTLIGYCIASLCNDIEQTRRRQSHRHGW